MNTTEKYTINVFGDEKLADIFDEKIDIITQPKIKNDYMISGVVTMVYSTPCDDESEIGIQVTYTRDTEIYPSSDIYKSSVYNIVNFIKESIICIDSITVEETEVKDFVIIKRRA